MLADEIQHDSAVDIASRLDTGHLKVIEVDLPSDGARFAARGSPAWGHILLL
jgi:hypothetical protein